MQSYADFSVMMSFTSAAITLIVAVYLLLLWTRCENRLMSDLPLSFGVSAIFLCLTLVFAALVSGDYIPDTMEIFRIKSLILSGAIVPFFAILLTIWLPGRRKYHPHMVFSLIAYWTLTSLLGPTPEIIMMLNIPLMLVFLIGVALTFFVTWKTGRLKEIRSELVLAATVILFISQISKVLLMSLNLVYIADLLTSLGIIVIGIAIFNPWKEKKFVSKTPNAP
ncbi:MAG: hypothetical protein ACTSQZ_05825, partial [Candidatus Thorarchaeota archaeon]